MRQGALVGGWEGSNKAGDVQYRRRAYSPLLYYTLFCVSCLFQPLPLLYVVQSIVFLFCPLLNASVDLQVQ